MKIALMTIWREKNFGAEMQCYATVRALQLLDYEVKVIDYRLSDIPNPTLKQKIIRKIISISPETKSFETFWSRYIPATRHYKNLEDLENDPPEAEIYLAGSDQIWNLNITKDKWKAFFLDFGKSVTKKISYASSFGESKWEWPNKKTEAKILLDKFIKLAVREKSGQSILKNEFQLPAELVIDPTLLHEDYKDLIGEPETKPILAYYPLGKIPGFEDFIYKVAQDLQLKPVNINYTKKLFGKITWERTTLLEWLETISSASLVITPSFHGLAFSLIYNRQFIIIQNQEGKGRSSRMTNLLETLGLSDRYFENVKTADNSKIWTKPIDFKPVNKILKDLRNKSWDYLKDNLK